MKKDVAKTYRWDTLRVSPVTNQLPNMKTITTLRRNSKKLAAAFTGGYTAKAYTLRNDFSGVDCSVDYVKEEFDALRFASASIKGEVITISIHSNCWYKLTPAFASV